ncbi:MAG: glycosyltransferase family 4 protein [Acidimicrobiales bacterium]
MKILVVHNRYRSSSPGGEDRVVDQEHEALIEAGHQVWRLERSNDEIGAFSVARKAAIPAGIVWSRRSSLDLDAALRAHQPDVVHLHNLFPLFSPSVLWACGRRRVPCVVTLHNYQQACVRGDLYRDGAICRACVGRPMPVAAVRHGCYHGSAVATVPLALSSVVHRRAWRTVPAAYLFVSEAQRRELAPLHFPGWRCFVKANLTLPAAPRARRRRLIVYLGRLTEAKGLPVLVRAWDRYARTATGPRLRLAIAGSGPLDAHLRTWARDRPSVDMLGLLGRDECADLVRRAAAVVAPSEWPEPFGLVVIEAMAAGVAPVTTRRGAFPDIIRDGIDGLLYPPGDDAALTEVLRRLDRSPELVSALGDAALATYRQRFTPARIVGELEDVYRFAALHPTTPTGLGPIPRSSLLPAHEEVG